MMKTSIRRLRDLLLASIRMELTDEDAIAFRDDVARKTAETNARGVVIDITALDVVDSFMARVLSETAAKVQLLGAEVVITGMRPEVEQTMAEMGRELVGVEIASDFEQGVEMVQRLIAASGHSPASGGKSGGRE